MGAISSYEARHALRDLRDGYFPHDYFYTTNNEWLRPVELGLRRVICWWRGHRFAEGANGEYLHLTWKRGCLTCGEVGLFSGC